MTVVVVTDSAADLPPTLARSLGIRVVPLSVTVGDRAFADGEDLTPEAFWELVAREDAAPTTASPPPEAFARAYREAADAGATAIVSVHLSGSLSRTLESARTAAAGAPVPVEVVDSRAVSAGEGLVALAAARAAAEGGAHADVAAEARDAPGRLRLFAMLDSAEFLRRGGRLAGVKAAASDRLRIRPVLTLADGNAQLVARSRTRSRGVEEVLARTAGPAEAATVIHSGAPEVDEVAARVEAACGVAPLTVLVGPAIGAHLGPRAVGVAVLAPKSASPSQ